MRLPFLNAVSRGKQQILTFAGLNLTEGWSDGELSACRNLTTAAFPCLSPRAGRRRVAQYAAPSALYAKEKLCVVDGAGLFYDGKKVGMVAAGEKQFAGIGNLVVVFPDKVYFDVEKETFGTLEQSYAASGLVFAAGSITTTGADFPFSVGDGVTIIGCATPENNKTAVVKGVNGKTLTFYENTFTAGTEAGSVTLKREIPDLDFICEWNNRLWGCAGNTIYASKYGDPRNFNVFDGLSSDSYYIDVGSDGAWTGCVPYGSHCCFWKEDRLHKLYGNKPANFQVNDARVHGVQAGCAGSMVCVNETLYYKGRGGVYAYNGGVPELISAKLGPRRFDGAVGGSDGERYYLSMCSGDAWALYVYDVMKGLWMMEDETHALGFAKLEGAFYLLSADGGLYALGETEADPAGPVEWEAEFCPFTEQVNERKGYSRLDLRLDLEAGAWMEAAVSCDNGPWRTVYTTADSRARTISVPIRPQRCDRFQVRLRGHGPCKVRSMIRTFFVGSEV